MFCNEFEYERIVALETIIVYQLIGPYTSYLQDTTVHQSIS